MIKRYQVFISSTYVDLKEERKKIMESVFRMDCIPVGMELFPATNEHQFDFIKKLIDESDFYLIVIAGRYGIVPSGSDISFTEMEYEYALSQNKPIIALINKAPEKISMEKSEINPKMRKKLEAFRKELEKSRLVQEWVQQEELTMLIPQSIHYAMQSYESQVKGWIRADVDVYRLSKLLNEYQGDMIVTLPIYSEKTPSHKKMIALHEVRGLMNLSNLFGKININLQLLVGDSVSSSQNRNEVCIGGPLANESSNAYVKMYVPSFRCIVYENADFFMRSDVDFFMDFAEKSTDGKQYFIIGNQKLEFSPEKNMEWGFVLKVEKGYNKFCFILFSETGAGTYAIIDFFCENYARLYDLFGESPFFIAIKLKVKGRMFADFRTIIDLSEYIQL